MEEQDQNNKKQQNKPWLKRIGLAGFLFFFIKGLVWIAIFLGLGTWLENC